MKTDDIQLLLVLKACFHITGDANLVFFGVTSQTNVTS